MFDVNEIRNLDMRSVMKFSDSKHMPKFNQNGNLQTNEFIYRISGDNITTFNGKRIFNTEHTLEFLPKRKDVAKYHVDIHNPGDSIVIYFNTDYVISDMPYNINTTGTKIGDTIIKMEKIWSQRECGYYHKCMSMMYQILYEIEILETVSYNQKHIKKIAPAVNYIHENFSSPEFSINSLPGMCDMSYSYFKKLFLSEYKMSPSKYITKLKMDRAVELLLLQNRNITELSRILGFENVYYFSKVFKDYYGMPPTAYRNQNRR